MSEYICNSDDKCGMCELYKTAVEIVRCRDCKHYYVAESYHPSGNYFRRCCKYFDTYDNEVEPYGFCAWGERREQ